MRRVAPIIVTCLAVAVFLGVGFGDLPFWGRANDSPSTTADQASARDQLASARSELAAARADLAVTGDQLSAALAELAARPELEDARAELAATRSELDDALAELAAAQSEFDDALAELAAAQSELAFAREELVTADGRLQSAEVELATTREDLAQLTAELATAKDTLSTGTFLRNPDYQEAIQFLKDDQTNLNRYVADSYTCRDFSADVIRNAEARGLRAAYVSIAMVQGSHAVIAFDTKDRGLIYVEPQNDKEVLLSVGQSYLKVNGYQAQTGVDDTMVHVTVIW